MWDQPHTAENITGYVLECTEQQHNNTKTIEVSPKSETVEASLDLEDQVEMFECKVWAFSKNRNGSVVSFNITTLGLHPVANLSLVGGCDGSLQATWSYTDADESGFNLTLCRMSEEKCNTTLVKKNVRMYKFLEEDRDVQYRLHVSAFGKISGVDVRGTEATGNATSFPEVPLLTDVVVKGASPYALMATWNTNWTHEIHFSVCGFDHSPQRCRNYNMPGSLLQANFTGLTPRTTYEVKSNGQVTYGNLTCTGPQTEQSASTYSLNPGPVCDLKYEVNNVTSLDASWDAPFASVDYDGYVLKCVGRESGAVRSVETLRAAKHANITLDLEEQLATFRCTVWAFAYNGTRRNNGTATEFSVRTNGIGPPKNVWLVERTATSLAYSWTKDPSARNCRVEVMAANASEVFEGNCTSPGEKDVNRYNVTSLKPGEVYNVSVQDCAAYCGLSTVITDHTDVAAPSEVVNFSAFVTGFLNATFTWERPAERNGPIDGYLIRVLNEDRNVTTEIIADGSATDVTIVVESEFAYFRSVISAYNIKRPGEEKLFGPETSTTFESLGNGPFPPHPTVEYVLETGAAICWETVEDPRYNITSYNISVEAKGSFPTKETKFNISHLIPWTRYVVSVSSCAHETGCGEARSTSFRTDVSAPSKPVRLSVGSVGQEWIYLEWERPDVPNGPIDGFNFSLVGQNASFNAVTKDLSYNVTQLSPATTYSVSLYAFNYGVHNEKRGQAATLTAFTSNVAKSTSVVFLIIAVVSFVITTGAVAAFCLGQQLKSNKGRRLATEEDGTELHAVNPWLRIRRKLCPSATFGEDPDEHIVN